MSNKQYCNTFNRKWWMNLCCWITAPGGHHRYSVWFPESEEHHGAFFSQKRGVWLSWDDSKLNECYGFCRGTQYPLPLWRKLPWIIYLLLLFFKLLGLKAKSDSFGFLSGCFLYEFTSNRSVFHPAVLQMPRTNHTTDSLTAALVLSRGSLSRKHRWKNRGNRQWEQSNH